MYFSIWWCTKNSSQKSLVFSIRYTQKGIDSTNMLLVSFTRKLFFSSSSNKLRISHLHLKLITRMVTSAFYLSAKVKVEIHVEHINSYFLHWNFVFWCKKFICNFFPLMKCVQNWKSVLRIFPRGYTWKNSHMRGKLRRDLSRVFFIDN